MQAKLKEAEVATAAEAAKLAALQEQLEGAAAERDSAHAALAASRQEAAAAQEQLADARKQVSCREPGPAGQSAEGFKDVQQVAAPLDTQQ